ncbi:MAG: ISAzo13 family transposase [Spirochaetales bacterium]|jgi:transposase|nr:ISAzo13 family transposase [Spirochaetales bacterium]
MIILEQSIATRFNLLEPTFNEKTRRIWAAAEAQAVGRGGIAAVYRATGISRNTICQGIKDLEDPQELQDISTRTRKPGGGRKKTVDINPEVRSALEALVEPITRGDPESPLRWTCKSLRNLAEELKDQGYSTSHRMVGELLHELGYSLQANRKTSEGKQHPDRNMQFEFINLLVEENLKKGNPVISVDAKKKELVGNFKNVGREWYPKGTPEQVNVYDFLSIAEGRATPYGVYDIGKDEGWVNVGIDKDTAVFAVESIRRWWYTMGQENYPEATELIITADGGGSNGSRIRLWKTQLQNFCNEIRIPIAVSHFPPGTSKWNKIEHRLFSFISMNWRGKPLTSFETILNLISATTSRSGLTVRAEIDLNKYPKGIKVSDAQMRLLAISRNEFHGEWNYILHPQPILNL